MNKQVRMLAFFAIFAVIGVGIHASDAAGTGISQADMAAAVLQAVAQLAPYNSSTVYAEGDPRPSDFQVLLSRIRNVEPNLDLATLHQGGKLTKAGARMINGLPAAEMLLAPASAVPVPVPAPVPALEPVVPSTPSSPIATFAVPSLPTANAVDAPSTPIRPQFEVSDERPVDMPRLPASVFAQASSAPVLSVPVSSVAPSIPVSAPAPLVPPVASSDVAPSLPLSPVTLPGESSAPAALQVPSMPVAPSMLNASMASSGLLPRPSSTSSDSDADSDASGLVAPHHVSGRLPMATESPSFVGVDPQASLSVWRDVRSEVPAGTVLGSGATVPLSAPLLRPLSRSLDSDTDSDDGRQGVRESIDRARQPLGASSMSTSRPFLPLLRHGTSASSLPAGDEGFEHFTRSSGGSQMPMIQKAPDAKPLMFGGLSRRALSKHRRGLPVAGAPSASGGSPVKKYVPRRKKVTSERKPLNAEANDIGNMIANLQAEAHAAELLAAEGAAPLSRGQARRKAQALRVDAETRAARDGGRVYADSRKYQRLAEDSYATIDIQDGPEGVKFVIEDLSGAVRPQLLAALDLYRLGGDLEDFLDTCTRMGVYFLGDSKAVEEAFRVTGAFEVFEDSVRDSAQVDMSRRLAIPRLPAGTFRKILLPKMPTTNPDALGLGEAGRLADARDAQAAEVVTTPAVTTAPSVAAISNSQPVSDIDEDDYDLEALVANSKRGRSRVVFENKTKRRGVNRHSQMTLAAPGSGDRLVTPASQSSFAQASPAPVLQSSENADRLPLDISSSGRITLNDTTDGNSSGDDSSIENEMPESPTVVSAALPLSDVGGNPQAKDTGRSAKTHGLTAAGFLIAAIMAMIPEILNPVQRQMCVSSMRRLLSPKTRAAMTREEYTAALRGIFATVLGAVGLGFAAKGAYKAYTNHNRGE